MRVTKPFSLPLALVLGAGVLPAVWSMTAAATPDGDDSAFAALRGFKPRGADVRVTPRDYAANRLDLTALRADLAKARSGSTIVSIPDPSGVATDFRIRQTQVMEDGLAAKHPEITTYAGRAVAERSRTIALDITPMGFHASVRSVGSEAGWYVDPAYNRRGVTQYLSYYGSDLPDPERRRAEGEVTAVRSAVDAKITADADSHADSHADSGASTPVQRRYYRLAMVSDPTYASFFGADNVLAEKVTLINRVNQIYNDDFAATLLLVNATEDLNFDTDAEATGPDGPCGAVPCYRVADEGDPADPDDDLPGDLDFCSGLTLGQNRTVLGQLVGASNYDVGHIALGSDGGGVAYLGVIGGDYKGGGCTGLSEPRGDFFAIDYVAHEIGHQFGGNHTFNGNQHNCSGGNREASASVEPGSGSSVMAYAGICRQDNLQPHSDPYFSQHTIEEYTSLATGAAYDNVEVQTVSLRGFDASGDSFQIGFGDSAPETIAFDDYSAATAEAAVEGVTGRDVSIAEWGFDEFGLSGTPVEPDTAGFQVIFNEAPTVIGADATDVDVPALTIGGTSAGVSGFVGETSRGGKSNAEGNRVENTSNLTPVVSAPADKTIPLRTPFALTGSATDANGDDLTYLWEQDDIGGDAGTALVDNAKTNGPLFRVFGTAAQVSEEGALETPSPGQNLADGNATRVFPDLAQILAGNTNAATGTCPPVTAPWPAKPTAEQVDCFSEFLPVAGYVGEAGNTAPAMKFRLTARDGYPNGGGTSYDDVTLTLDPGAGPFLVTSQAAAGQTVKGGVPMSITWDVNSTNALAANVRISLSTDGGKTFDKVLSASTPNDGSEKLKLPNVAATNARVKIEAVDNYFFDISDADFAISKRGAPDTTFQRGAKGIVLTKKARLAFGSDLADATFECTLDRLPVRCADGVVKVWATPGTHTVTAAARTEDGLDPSPVTRTYTVPEDDTSLKASAGWRRQRDRSAFGGEVSTSRVPGATLSMRVYKAKRVVLVVSTGKAAGSVKVLLGKRLLKTVSTAGKADTQVLRGIKVSGSTSGTLRIQVAGKKPVRIEGVAVVTARR